MDFRGWIPPEMYALLFVSVVARAFIMVDWVIPFVSHHVSFH